MRNFILGAIFAMISALAGSVSAQQTVWVQIEAQPNLARAQGVARKYAASLQSVNGFAMRTGWYAIALGPFSPADAQDTLKQLRITRQIPQDSYIADGTAYRDQFWPVGAQTSAPGAPLSPSASAPTATPAPTPAPTVAVASPPVSDETRAQAKRSEAKLSREERELLQKALKWEGFYTAAVDGAIGPGTRKSMAAWQRQEGYEATGVLTSLQRQTLVRRYQDLLASVGMQTLLDTAIGIQIDLPMALVELDRYEPPFAHFKARTPDGVKVLLISQTGDAATLRGLYDIMQTLEIVPLNGSRQIKAKSFTLTGENAEISSYTYAALANGQVKGFTLIWPTGTDKRHTLVLNGMKNSFRALLDTVLPDVYGDPNAAQSVDLLSGLVVRKPALSRSGFYISADGAVLTTAQVVASCQRVTLDDTQEASVAAVDAATGLALLRPTSALSPIRFAQLRSTPPRLSSEIAVSGYSYDGLLGAPTLTFGTLADLRGLAGEANLDRLALDATPSDAGGPVIDGGGAVVGILLPADDGGTRRLPAGVSFAANSGAITEFLGAQGITVASPDSFDALAPEDLTTVGADMTVLVSCWN
jgi:peptidoglycan hydrolase-like protein with peptidoglycan-binding domain